LQEGEIQPLGEQRPQKVDVRIIAATNTDLEAMVADGRFREDLYYRLNVIRLRVPPLRERRSEIPSLVNYYVEHFSAKFREHGVRISPQAVDLLMVYDWPGNVRQLVNEIQRVIARAEDGTTITPDHLSPELRRRADNVSLQQEAEAAFASGLPFWHGMSVTDALEHLEYVMVTDALRRHGGNVTRTAQHLGITRRGLQLKLARFKSAG
jgi:Nif-specific regulatory protein